MNAEQLLAKHLERFGAQDLEGILSEYAEDVVFFTRDQVFRGKQSLRPLFEGMFAEFSGEGVSFELLNRETEGDWAYIVWKAETPATRYLLGTDTMVLRDGKIVMQSSAVEAVAKSE